MLVLASLLVTVLRYRPILGKNSTLAVQIEISCPLFVVPFALVLWRETHVNARVLGDGLMVSAGVTLTITE